MSKKVLALVVVVVVVVGAALGSILLLPLRSVDASTHSVTWQWSKADTGPGTYSDIDGATMASYTLVVEDLEKFLKATATYTDAQGSGKTVESTVLTQEVQKVRNLAPVFTDEDEDADGIQVDPRTVDEDADATDVVGAPVVATDTVDAERGDDNAISYRLSGADAASFTIGTGNSQIMVGANAMLDYEATKNTYMVTVTASD